MIMKIWVTSIESSVKGFVPNKEQLKNKNNLWFTKLHFDSGIANCKAYDFIFYTVVYG